LESVCNTGRSIILAKKGEDGIYVVETNPTVSLPVFNLLVAADGEQSRVAKEFGFARKEFSGSLCLGITFNFVNNQTPDEVQLREFGISKQFQQHFFRELYNDYGIDLENLVYYRGETHYFVMTAKRECLVHRKVFVNSEAESSVLLNPENINNTKLLSVVHDVAKYVGIPDTCDIVKVRDDKPDIAIFDFSRRLMSDEAAKNLSKNQYVSLVGDALLEPFWPQGTGCNRALLSALDTVWMLRDIGKNESPEKIVQNRFSSYIKMKNALGGSISQPYSKCGVDPLSRYGSGKEFHGVL